MAGIFGDLGSAICGPLPPMAHLVGEGPVNSGAVITGAERPLHLWVHHLQAGSRLMWRQPRQAHAVFVWRGAVRAEGAVLHEHEALLVENGASASLTAEAPATVLEFYRAEDHPEPPTRKGGHVHTVGAANTLHGLTSSGVGMTYWADAGCPTCEMWLHGTRFPDARKLRKHYHSEDEIIVVVEGELCLGRRPFRRGGVLALDADTPYTFAVGDEGLNFINYRAAHPYYKVVGDDGPPIDERAHMKDALENYARSNAHA